MSLKSLLTSLLSLAFQLYLLRPVCAQTVTFIKIIDAGTTIPLVPELSSFSTPALSNGLVSFRVIAAEGYQGIFHTNARSFTKLADTDTALPESSGTFTSLGTPSFSSLYGAFLAQGDSTQGIYSAFGGPLPEKVATLDDPVPGRNTPFTLFLDPAIYFDPLSNAGQVVFLAQDATFLPGIYSYGIGDNRDAKVIADSMTTAPGSFGDIFIAFTDPVVDAGVVAFRGTGLSGNSGIYKYTDLRGLETVANTTTRIPDGAGTFSEFGSPFSFSVVATGAGDVAFRGDGSGGQQGIYAQINGALEVIADLDTPVPNGNGNFIAFFDEPPSISNGNVAFIGISANPNQSALYARLNGTLQRIVGPGDNLDTETVTGVTIGPQALDGKFLAFHARFNSGSEAIYLAAFDIAEPASADFNGDGIVNRKDIIAVIRALGPCPESEACPQDLDGNGEVNIKDLLEVLGNRGRVNNGPPVNDECTGAIDIGSAGNIPFSTLGATTSNILLAPRIGGNFADAIGLDCNEGSGLDLHNDIWFSFIPPATCDILTASTCSTADFDTRLAVYVLPPESASLCELMEPLGCNDDSPGCNTTSIALAFPHSPLLSCEFDPICNDPAPSQLFIRVGSRDPDLTGSGTLSIGCEPITSEERSGNSPEACEFIPGLTRDGNEISFIAGETVPGYRGVFDDTPGCGDSDTNDFWYCFVAPCTGVISANVSAHEQGKSSSGRSITLLTVAAYNALGNKMLACSSDDSGLAQANAKTFWGAVTGNRYLIRVGFFPESSFDITYNLSITCEQDDSCGWPFTGPCFSDNQGIPGCDDGICCTQVCESDPYCCNIEWDDLCAGMAVNECEVSTQLCEDILSEESCYGVHGSFEQPSPGCKIEECCEDVCQIDPACCDFAWDIDCVKIAASVCPAPQCPVVTDLSCFDPSLVPGCSDAACCGKVCDADPLCCNLDWSQQCVSLAEVLCER